MIAKILLNVLIFAAVVVAALLVLASPLIFLVVGWYIYWRHVKKLKPPKSELRKVKVSPAFKRLFWDFPRQFALDRCTLDPNQFPEKGVHIIEGEQGDGKTLTVCYLLMLFQQKYPRLKVKTNFGYKYEDGQIRSHHDIIDSSNGIFGEIDVIDEVQNWFCSLQSKNFPPEMMTEITQQRKQRKCIIGTSQVFTRVAKPIREQTYILYTPTTLFGCLTIVRKSKPVFNADGVVESKKPLGSFFFVHSQELRDSYDTYHKIQEMVKDGFKVESERPQ